MKPSGLIKETHCCKVGAAALSFVIPDFVGIVELKNRAILEGLGGMRREDRQRDHL